MKKIVSIVGARPQFVKAAAVSRIVAGQAAGRECLVHTGQHYDSNMSEVFFSELGIPQPHYNLAIGSASHGAQTGRMLEAIEGVLLQERPDWVLIYGDTNSTLAGAIAAAKLHIPVAHVEAGLRSFNRAMPEEINRILADHASTVLFAPTRTAVAHLQSEGIDASKIVLSGDVMYDAARHFHSRAIECSTILQSLGLRRKGFVLATVHRAENTDDPAKLAVILGALAAVAGQTTVVLPLHPRTRASIAKAGLALPAGMVFIDPVGYLDMVMLEEASRLIVTDSGGVQKEAFFFKVPCVTLRHETEWTELVAAGWNTLLPPRALPEVVAGLQAALAAEAPTRWPSDLYGSGAAAQLIVDHLLR